MARKREPQLTKARAALVAAFRRLLMKRPYGDIHVPDIVLEADVSRATFYVHFRNKNDILRASLSQVISLLSMAGFPDLNIAQLTTILNHFQRNPDLCKICLNSPISTIVVELLAEEIRQRLLMSVSEPELMDSSTARFTSIQAAEASVGLIRAWISDLDPAPTEWIAHQLDSSARALTSLAKRPNKIKNEKPQCG